MSIFDANAFVVSGSGVAPASSANSTLTNALSSNTVANGDVFLLIAPCDLEVNGIQIYAGTPGTTTGTSFNVKVVPPTTASVYARSYNYSSLSKVVSTLATTDGITWTGTTTAAHGLSTSSVIKLANFFNPAFNLTDKPVASVPDSTSFTITTADSYQLPLIAANGLTNVNGNVYTFATSNAHGLKAGDYVTTGTITGATTAYTITSAAKVTSIVDSKTFKVDISAVLPGLAANTVGAGAITSPVGVKVFPTFTSPVGSGLAQTVSVGTLAAPVQDQLAVSDLNVAADYTPAPSKAFWAYGVDLLVPAATSTAQFGAAAAAYSNDSRLNNVIKAGSHVYLSVVTASTGAKLSGLNYAVEFTKN
jgi:hypothetical protein